MQNSKQRVGKTRVGLTTFQVIYFSIPVCILAQAGKRMFAESTVQLQLHAVNFIPLLGSLYMFRVFYAPIIRSTIFNCIYSHWYKP
jgi:hypothetical protein